MTEIEVFNERKAWCFDFRTGWAEIDDVVAWYGDRKLEDALKDAGFDPCPQFCLYKNCSIELTVYARGRVRGDVTSPAYLVVIVYWDTSIDEVYCTNLPSFLAFLQNMAPICASAFASDQEEKRREKETEGFRQQRPRKQSAPRVQ